MKINENSKVTLTLGQLRKLVEEAADPTPTTKMNDNIIRLDGCKLQRALCWGFDGFVIVHKKLNPSFSKRLPYINIIYQDNVDNPNWQIHFLNFEGGKVDREMVDEMLKCVADTCKENKIDIYSWNSTPGGISGISRLSKFGMVKKYLPVKKGDNRYWGGHINKTKLTDWLTSGKHDEDFLVRTDDGDFVSPKDYDGEIDGSNTVPRPFVMVAESVKAKNFFLRRLVNE